MKQVLLIIFVLQSISQLLSAQGHDIKFEHLSTQQGLSHGIVNCILQDKEGFMWFGTRDGLNRYDGYTFLVYDHVPNDTNSISSNLIQSIYEDRSGTLWIGTNAGLNKFNKATNTFTLYKHKANDNKSISDDNIRSIYEDRFGTLWIGTYDGLNKFNRADNTFTLYQHNPVGDNWVYNLINTIYEDQLGILWLGTNRGLSKFTPKTGKFSYFQHNTQSRDSLNFYGAVDAITEDKYGTLWIGTARDGLKEFNRQTNTFKVYQHQPDNLYSISDNNILSLFIDSFGTLWVGTQYGGLNKYDPITGKFTHYIPDPNHAGAISNNSIISLYEDRSKVLWIGTFSSGINKVNLLKKKFIHCKHNLLHNSIRDNFIYALYKDHLGAIWVGHRLGIDKLDRTTGLYTHYAYDRTHPKNLSSNTAHCIYEDKSKNLWIGLSGGGLKKFNRKTDQFTTYLSDANDVSSLPNNMVHSIYEDKKGTLWVGTLEGLSKFNPYTEDFITYTPRNLVKPRFGVTSIVEDETGILWLATRTDGLYQFDPENGVFTKYPYNAKNFPKQSSTPINCIFKDRLGTFWISLEAGGLHTFDPKTSAFTAVTSPEQLARIVINGIMEDNSGNLWLFTGKSGIYKFNPLTKSLRNYDIHDGLQSNEFNKAFCKGTNGEMYAGGNNGFNVFHPDSIQDNAYVPQVAITGFKVFDKPRDFFGKEIILPYSDSFFSFDFVALSYAIPEKNQYAYKLENFDQEWIQAGSRRYASYTNLDPGEYILRVKAANYDGVWNQKGTSIKIIITPPIWRTYWAYVLYFFFFLGMLYGLRQYTIRREHLKNNLRLQRLESEKLQELDQMRSQFFANISHEFRTPLTLILAPLEKFIAHLPEKSQDKPMFQVMQRNARRLLELINQLLYLSKLEAGSMKLEVKPGDIVEFIRTRIASFSSIAESRQINFSFNTDPQEIYTGFDWDKVEKIVYNLLSNAFKFTPDKGEVLVSISLKEGQTKTRVSPQIQIQVNDTGIGIAPDRTDKIFDRFYQVDSSYTRNFEGTGIGLSLTKELVELHKGTIRVTSQEGNGTCFTVELPFIEIHRNVQKEMENIKPAYSINSHVALHHFSNERFKLQSPIDEQIPLVLIVEDNLDLRTYIRFSFEGTYRMMEAKDGVEGMTLALETIPDLIISDLMMPKMNGVELCAQLKTDIRTSHIPFILLTARATVADKLQGLETGADDYITKPFHTDELIVRVKNLIVQRKKLRERYSQELTLVSTTMSIPLVNEIPAVALSATEEKFLQKLTSIVETNLSNSELGIELFEKEMGMSNVQLYRKIKALTDRTPGEFIRNFRLKKAAHLLAQKQGNISQVAYAVGFTNLSYFTKCFKQVYGITPSEYIENPTKS